MSEAIKSVASAQEIAEAAQKVIDKLEPLLNSSWYKPDTLTKAYKIVLSAITAAEAQGREWNQLLELQLNNLRSLYDELNDAVVGYLEMRLEYQDLLPHLTLKNEIQSPRAAVAAVKEEDKILRTALLKIGQNGDIWSKNHAAGALRNAETLDLTKPRHESTCERQKGGQLTSFQRAARLFIQAKRLGCDTPTEGMIADAIQDAEFDTLHNSDMIAERHGGQPTEIKRLRAAILQIKRTLPSNGGYVRIGEICDSLLASASPPDIPESESAAVIAKLKEALAEIIATADWTQAESAWRTSLKIARVALALTEPKP